MTEPVRAYVVALSFADGLGIVQTVAPNAESAAAMVGVRAGRAHEGDPLAIAWAELTPEWLRMALRACETGKAGGDVVSLVSDNLKPTSSIGAEAARAGIETIGMWPDPA